MNGSEAERPQAIREALQQIEAEIPRRRRYARYLGHEPDHADDLVREGLVRAVAEVHSAIASIDTGPPGTSLRGWLFTILRSCHIEETRPRPASGCAGQRPGGILADNPPQPGSGRRPAHAARCLSQPQRGAPRGAAARGHRGGLQHGEAAAILGVPLGAVRFRLSQGRQALRQALEAGRAALAEPAAGAPHAGHQHLIGPCIAVSMARGRAARASGFREDPGKN